MRAVLVVALALLAVVTAGLGLAVAQEVVKVGDLGIVGDGAIYIGIEKGYFKERGITVKLEKFPSAATAMAPLSTGDIHVVGGGISPALFNGVARGMPIKIVAPRARDIDGNSVDVLMVRADLKDPVRKIADLKGKKVAINATGSALTYMLGRMLESEGLSLKDVELVYMPWPDMGTAFANKAIDAGTIVDPFTAQFEEKKLATLLRRASDVVRNPWFEVSVLLYNAEWAKKTPKVAGDFAVAYLRAARELHDAMYGGPNRADVVDILTRNTRVKDKALYDRMHWGHIDPNGVVSRDSIKEQQEWWVRQGTVTKRVDIDDLVDDSFMKYAVEQLGPHRGR
jgi:NitT/TauT family transport system substrate-binding protein